VARRSSREMKCTGTPKKVLATLFLHASGLQPSHAHSAVSPNDAYRVAIPSRELLSRVGLMANILTQFPEQALRQK
jgi:hypothetical protein